MNIPARNPVDAAAHEAQARVSQKLRRFAFSCSPPVLPRSGVAQLPMVRLKFCFPGSVERSA